MQMSNVFNLAFLIFVDIVLLCANKGQMGGTRNEGRVEGVDIDLLAISLLFASSVHSSLSIFSETPTN